MTCANFFKNITLGVEISEKKCYNVLYLFLELIYEYILDHAWRSRAYAGVRLAGIFVR
jgi:hypothetical protein